MADVTWEHVPQLVPRRWVAAARVRQQILPHLTEKVSAFINTGDGHVRLVGDLTDCQSAARHLTRFSPEIADLADPEDYVCVKLAAPLGILGNAWTGVNKVIGGPNPLTNSIVGGLVGGGLGYAGGAMMEHLFPERFLERGKLRKTLGALGAGMGVLPGAWKGYTYGRNDGTSFLQGMTTPDSAPPVRPELQKLSQELADIEINDTMRRLNEHASIELIKQSYGGALDVQSVPVDAFNRAVWNDMRLGIAAQNNPYGSKSQWGDDDQAMHTPPQLAAAATGLMSGIAQQMGTPILRPRDVIAGLASAGVGLVTANIAGRTLSALAGLTPEAQLGLQQAGMWGGIIRHIVPPLFGYR